MYATDKDDSPHREQVRGADERQPVRRQPIAAPQLVDNRPSATRQAKLQRAADASAPVQVLAQRQALTKAPRAIMQRQIILGGKRPTPEEIFRDLGINEADTESREIVRAWCATERLHLFSGNEAKALENLQQAIKRARAARKPGEIENYTKDRLKFVTKAEGREPTLYFVGEQAAGPNQWSGRIRQQHGSGPLVSSQMNKEDYFFDTKEKFSAFRDELKLLKEERDALAEEGHSDEKSVRETYRKGLDTLLKAHKARTGDDFAVGDSHFEVTRDMDGLVRSTHPSGGQIGSAAGFEQEHIDRIYRATVGLPERGAPAPAVSSSSVEQAPREADAENVLPRVAPPGR